MITVILKDGTEVPVNDANLPAPHTPYGQDDTLLAIYRTPERVWVLDYMTTLRPGDCFRKLDEPESVSTVYVVTRKPRAICLARWPHQERYTIVMEGLTLDQLSNLPPPVARSLASSSREVTTSHQHLLLEY